MRAAGGIVVRRGADGGPEVLLVHRPHYGDWSFPKGKTEAGESDEECALREVDEETGVRATIGPLVGETHYRDASGRPKSVAYFLMTTDDGPHPGDKVDDVRWASVGEALDLLTWKRDADLLRDAAARGAVDPV